MTEPSFTNELIHSSSPYLLQHANNPVRWQEWNSKSLQQALDQNKPILVSIGYSSCHWCHVMAHESFEDEEVAAIMNEHFVNIKIDREERPDVDQIYMDAVQAMGLRGGWPLNVFLTPDQKPFYGGTYFPKENWKKLLGEVARAYRENEEKLSESADKIAESLIDDFTKKYGLSTENAPLSGDDFQELYKKLEIKFDSEWGGILKEPKFPMPSVWQFLLHFQQLENHQEARKHFLFTLNKIANGGIYDHIGGGFARYSVDGEWHVPHFEKMLYDNGQLLSLYANAYKLTASPLYKDVIMETASWLKREMTHKNGGFYAALDADSEGVEGKFYVWTEQQVNELTDNQELIKTYFNITAQGNWEHGNNVLRRIIDQNEVIEKFNVSATELHEIISDFKEQALKERDKRIRPGLDNKIIAGWNGLMLSGLIDAYQATREESLLVLAKANAEFISGSLVKDGSLLRIAGLNTQGFMEDYSAVIQAFIKYYETTFEESYLEFAKVLTDQALDEFFDKNEKLFFFTSNQSETLIARKKELFDNVIPASNSIMAENLLKLGTILDNPKYKKVSAQMVRQVSELIKREPEYLSNWAVVATLTAQPLAEIIIVGQDYKKFAQELQSRLIPNKIIQGTRAKSDLPLFQYKEPRDGETTIYVCYDKSCKRPVNSVKEALEQLSR